MSTEAKPAVKKKPAKKKKKPRELAIVHFEGCTGCEVCIAFCPVDCIYVIPGKEHPTLNPVVDIDLDKCIGCNLCAKYCPWETIEMLPYDDAMRWAGREDELEAEAATG